MPYQFTIVEGPDQGRSAQITGNECFIGRDTYRCSLVLTDEEASRKHARVTVSDDGAIYIEDNASSNGTFVNNEKISNTVRISPGDRVRIGTTVLGLVPASQPAPVSPASLGAQETSSIRIGRDPSNHLVINDPQVSRSHARIDLIAGVPYLIDTSSTGFTYIDGHQIIAPTPLRPTAQIKIGDYSYIFERNQVFNPSGEVVAAFPLYTPSPSEQTSFSKALAAPFSGMAIARWLLGSLLAVIPIIGFLAEGYRFQLIKNGQKGSFTLPNWQAFGQLFHNGFRLFLVQLAYLLLPVVYFLVVLFNAPPAPAERWIDMFQYLRGWLLLFGLLFFALAGLILPMALAHFASTGSMEESLKVNMMIQVIQGNLGQYILLMLLLIGLWLIVWFLMTFVPYAGPVLGIIGGFYIVIVSSLLFGEFYARSEIQVK